MKKPPSLYANALGTIVVAAMLSLPPPTQAVVLFEASTATGFADAGDLLQVLGWSDSDLYSRHSALIFQYRGTEKLGFVCQWSLPSSGARGEEPRFVERPLDFRVVTLPIFDTQSGKKIQRFQFFGRDQIDSATDSQRLRGQPCVSSGGVPGQINGIQRISAMGGLYLNYQGMTVRLMMNNL